MCNTFQSIHRYTLIFGKSAGTYPDKPITKKEVIPITEKKDELE